MLEVKRVVVYGLVNSTRDHRDYALIGEWEFDLYNRVVLSVSEPPAYRVQHRYVSGSRAGQFAPGPTHQDKAGHWRASTGQFASGPTREIHVTVPFREKVTGRYAEQKPVRLIPTPIPDDDTIVADVFRIVEQETGHRMYRTPGQREHDLDRVSIGIQHLDDSELKRTYTYDEFLKELRHRVHNEWEYR